LLCVVVAVAAEVGGDGEGTPYYHCCGFGAPPDESWFGSDDGGDSSDVATAVTVEVDSANGATAVTAKVDSANGATAVTAKGNDSANGATAVDTTVVGGRCLPGLFALKCYPMFGIWKGQTIKDKKGEARTLIDNFGFTDNAGRSYQKGDTVYFSELSVVPKDMSIFGSSGSGGEWKNYGVWIFSAQDRRDNKKEVDKLLAWRKIQYQSGMKLKTWADTVNFVFDNLRGISGELDELLKSYEPKGQENPRRRFSVPRDQLLKKIEGKVIGLPFPDDINVPMNSNMFESAGFPDMFWYYAFYWKALSESLKEEDEDNVSLSENFLNVEDWMKSTVEEEMDLTIYNAGSPGKQGDIAKDPEYGEGIDADAMVDKDHAPGGFTIFDPRSLKLLSGQPMLLNPTAGVSYNLRGLYKIRPNVLSRASIGARYLECVWGDTVRTCDYCTKDVATYCTVGKHIVNPGAPSGDGGTEDSGGMIHKWTETHYARRSYGGRGGTSTGVASPYTVEKMLTYDERIEGNIINKRTWRVFYTKNSKNQYQKDSVEALLIRIDTLYKYNDKVLSDGYQYWSYWDQVTGTLKLVMSDNEFDYYGQWHWGWFHWEAPYDPKYIGTNINGERELDGRGTEGDVTQRVKAELETLRGKFNNFVKNFVCDSVSVPYVASGSSRGRDAIKQLYKNGFYFEATDVGPGGIKRLDSAWFFANPHNGYNPYTDADDFIIRNSYYNGASEFLKLWMEDGKNDGRDYYDNINYYLIFKWPLVYKDANNVPWIVGYAVYKPERKIYQYDDGRSVKNPKSGKETEFYVHKAPVLGRNVCRAPEGEFEGVKSDVMVFLNKEWKTCDNTEVKIGTSNGELTYLCINNVESVSLPSSGFKSNIDKSNDTLKCKLLGNIYLEYSYVVSRTKYDYFGQFTATSFAHNNNYLTLVPVHDSTLSTDTVAYQQAWNRYSLKDYAADNVDPADRASNTGGPDITRAQIWDIVEKILIAEGLNATVKGVYYIATHPEKFPWFASVAGAIAYKTNEYYENSKIAKGTVKWIKRGWRLYKEFQETLDLVNSAVETWGRIDETWQGLVTAADNIREYYNNFEWEGPWWKVTQILPAGKLRRFDAAVARLQGAVSDFGHVCDAMAWKADTFYIAGSIGLVKEGIDALTRSNLVDAEIDIMMASDMGNAVLNTQKKTKSRSVTKGQYLSRGTGVVLLHFDNIHAKIMSNGITALATTLDFFEKESEDWAKLGRYIASACSTETWAEIGNKMVEGSSAEGRMYVSPLASALRPPNGLFEQNVKERIGVVGQHDFWASPYTWDFVTVDGAQIRKARVRDSTERAKARAKDSTERAMARAKSK